jgi:hypothetical protein
MARLRVAEVPPLKLRRSAQVAFVATVLVVRSAAQSTGPVDAAESQRVIVIQAYEEGLAGVRASNPDVHVSVARDPSIAAERVLIVEYPAPTVDPAGRDVQCAATNRNWTGGRAISFQVKPTEAVRLSVSFLDRNRVAYTSWIDLKGGMWQTVRIPFDEMRPNPFFQPPDAKRGAPLDVSEVEFIAFAPQDKMSGRLTISRIVVSQ